MFSGPAHSATTTIESSAGVTRCQPTYCALRLSDPFAFYRAFGVARDATVDAIREEYKKLALHYHPDKHAASERDIWNPQFQILNTICDTFLNKEERQKYDRQSRRAARIAAVAARDAMRDVGRASLVKPLRRM